MRVPLIPNSCSADFKALSSRANVSLELTSQATWYKYELLPLRFIFNSANLFGSCLGSNLPVSLSRSSLRP